MSWFEKRREKKVREDEIRQKAYDKGREDQRRLDESLTANLQSTYQNMTKGLDSTVGSINKSTEQTLNLLARQAEQEKKTLINWFHSEAARVRHECNEKIKLIKLEHKGDLYNAKADFEKQVDALKYDIAKKEDEVEVERQKALTTRHAWENESENLKQLGDYFMRVVSSASANAKEMVHGAAHFQGEVVDPLYKLETIFSKYIKQIEIDGPKIDRRVKGLS